MNKLYTCDAPYSRPLTRRVLTGVVSACLAACGGGEIGSEDGRADARAQVSAESFPTLLDDTGAAMPSMPQAVPADAAARTRQGRYASAQQADQLERALGDAVLRVNVECCGSDGVDQAIGIAYGVQAAGDLPRDTPVLVRSADLRLGAVAANRLADAGYGNVWLVTR